MVNLALALTGVALIIRPTFLFGSSTTSAVPLSSYPNYYWSAASAALSAILQGAVFVLLRKLKEVDVSAVMLAFGLIALALSSTAPPAVGLSAVSLPACCLDRWLMVIVGALSLLGQIGLTTSSKLESAAVVSLVTKTFDVVLALAFQTLWFQVKAFFFVTDLSYTKSANPNVTFRKYPACTA